MANVKRVTKSLRLEITNPNDIPQDQETMIIKEQIRLEKLANPEPVRVQMNQENFSDDLNRHDSQTTPIEVVSKKGTTYTKNVTVSPQARALQGSSDLRSNGIKYHSLDDTIQKKLDKQNNIRTIEINPKFSINVQTYFDGYNFFTQEAGYTLDEINKSKIISLRIYDGIMRGSVQFKSIREALAYIFALKGDLKSYNAIIFNSQAPNDILIGFGKYKPFTKERYLSINKPYEQRQKENKDREAIANREQIKVRNLAKMLKKD